MNPQSTTTTQRVAMPPLDAPTTPRSTDRTPTTRRATFMAGSAIYTGRWPAPTAGVIR